VPRWVKTEAHKQLSERETQATITLCSKANGEKWVKKNMAVAYWAVALWQVWELGNLEIGRGYFRLK